MRNLIGIVLDDKSVSIQTTGPTSRLDPRHQKFPTMWTLITSRATVLPTERVIKRLAKRYLNCSIATEVGDETLVVIYTPVGINRESRAAFLGALAEHASKT